MAVLLETTNNFGRQHHLHALQSQPSQSAAPGCESKQMLSATSLADLPQPRDGCATDRTACVSMPALWVDAEACTRCGQRAASPASCSQSASNRWHDAVSDIASATCSTSVPDCSAFFQTERQRILADGLESASSLDTAGGSARQSLFQETAREWQAAEQASYQRELQVQPNARQEAQHIQKQSLWRQIEPARRCACQAQQQAQRAVAEADAASRAAARSAADAEAHLEAQVAAARLVSGVFGRITGAAAAQEELMLLRGHLQHLSGMNKTLRLPVESQLHGADAHDGLHRHLVHTGLAVGCAALGLAGAYLVTRRSN